MVMLGGLLAGDRAGERRTSRTPERRARSRWAQPDARAHRDLAQASREAGRDEARRGRRARPRPLPHRHVPARRRPAGPVPPPPLRDTGRGLGVRRDAMLPGVARAGGRERGRHRCVRGRLLDQRPRRGGIPTIALEGDPGASRTAMLAVRWQRTRERGRARAGVDPGERRARPRSDCTICLSVWHHFVRHNGLERATEMLETIWDRNAEGAVLRHGRGANDARDRLPEMAPDPVSWLSTYLATTMPGSRVEQLGTHAAFDRRVARAERNLFAVRIPALASR